MHRIVLFVFVMVVAAWFVPSCSQSDADKTADAKKMSTDQPTDTLAAKRYPVRNADNKIVTLETDFGKMTIELYHDVAPAHADSFLARCKDGFYSGTIFHRVIKNFMIQGGNPQPAGKQNVPYFLPNELNDLQHDFGALSMASAGAPTTAKTQFFICLARNRSTEYLDGKYVVFGHLLKGFDVLRKIGDVPVAANKWMPGEASGPVEDVHLIKAYESDADGNPITQ